MVAIYFFPENPDAAFILGTAVGRKWVVKRDKLQVKLCGFDASLQIIGDRCVWSRYLPRFVTIEFVKLIHSSTILSNDLRVS